MARDQSPVARLDAMWRRLSPLPGGRWFFSRLLGFVVPYSGTVRATVLELRAGHARVALKDRRRVRNHLRSIHAIALANLGELATGLALNVGLPSDARGILTGLSIAYFKKARGTLVAECDCEVPITNAEAEYDIEAAIRDAESDVVAKVNARWRVGPTRG